MYPKLYIRKSDLFVDINDKPICEIIRVNQPNHKTKEGLIPIINNGTQKITKVCAEKGDSAIRYYDVNIKIKEGSIDAYSDLETKSLVKNAIKSTVVIMEPKKGFIINTERQNGMVRLGCTKKIMKCNGMVPSLYDPAPPFSGTKYYLYLILSSNNSIGHYKLKNYNNVDFQNRLAHELYHQILYHEKKHKEKVFPNYNSKNETNKIKKIFLRNICICIADKYSQDDVFKIYRSAYNITHFKSNGNIYGNDNDSDKDNDDILISHEELCSITFIEFMKLYDKNLSLCLNMRDLRQEMIEYFPFLYTQLYDKIYPGYQCEYLYDILKSVNEYNKIASNAVELDFLFYKNYILKKLHYLGHNAVIHALYSTTQNYKNGIHECAYEHTTYQANAIIPSDIKEKIINDENVICLNEKGMCRGLIGIIENIYCDENSDYLINKNAVCNSIYQNNNENETTDYKGNIISSCKIPVSWAPLHVKKRNSPMPCNSVIGNMAIYRYYNVLSEIVYNNESYIYIQLERDRVEVL